MRILGSDYTELALDPIADRLFRVSKPFRATVLTTDGKLTYEIEEGFVTDMRSGGKFVDFLIPWTGDQATAVSWLLHDVNYYGYVSFHFANQILQQMLLRAKMSPWRASIVYWSVEEFGEGAWTALDETPPEPEYAGNKDRVKFAWGAP